MLDELAVLQRAVERDGGLLLENPAALERMESTGRVKPHLARDFGLVGVAGRASGSTYDVRTALVDDTCAGLVVASSMAGDVLARVRVRADELRESLRLIHHVLHLPLEGPLATPLPTRLPAGAAAGLVEAWRGELVHFIVSGGDGHIERYAIKDPSLNNWTGLAIAARHELVFDFPLCNKSFGLSYSGHDL